MRKGRGCFVGKIIYFRVTAVDYNGLESELSDEVSWSKPVWYLSADGAKLIRGAQYFVFSSFSCGSVSYGIESAPTPQGPWKAVTSYAVLKREINNGMLQTQYAVPFSAGQMFIR